MSSGYVSEFEWLASGGHVFYPFSTRPRLDGADISHVIVDAFLFVPDGWEEPRLEYLRPGASTWLIGLQDGDSGARIEIEAPAKLFGPWTILADERVRLLVLTEAVPDFDWSKNIDGGWLVPHVLQRAVKTLTGLVVHGQKLQGLVTLENGYNSNLYLGATADRPDGRVTSTLNVSLPAGAGEGTLPCDKNCADRPIININGVQPNTLGDLALDGLDCYSVDARLEQGAHGVLRAVGMADISNSCSPCCDCSDYGYMYGEVLSGLNDRSKALATALKDAQERYKELLDSYNRLVVCRMKPEVALQVTGMHGRTAAIALGFKNNGTMPWPAAARQMTVTVTPEPRLVIGSPVLYDGSDSSIVEHSFAGGVFTFTLDPVPCCTSHWVSFNVVWDGIGGFVEFTAKASGSIEGTVFDLEEQGVTLLNVNRKRE